MLKARGKCLPKVAGLGQPEENHTGVRPRGRTGAAVPREPLLSEPLSHQTPPGKDGELQGRGPCAL